MGADLLRGQQASGAAPAKRVQAARRRIYGRARPSVHGDNERRRREEAGVARGGAATRRGGSRERGRRRRGKNCWQGGSVDGGAARDDLWTSERGQRGKPPKWARGTASGRGRANMATGFHGMEKEKASGGF